MQEGIETQQVKGDIPIAEVRENLILAGRLFVITTINPPPSRSTNQPLTPLQTGITGRRTVIFSVVIYLATGTFGHTLVLDDSRRGFLRALRFLIRQFPNVLFGRIQNLRMEEIPS